MKQSNSLYLTANATNDSKDEAAAADFIAGLSKNLALTARSNGLPFLGHLLEMAHAEAVSTLAKHQDSIHSETEDTRTKEQA